MEKAEGPDELGRVARLHRGAVEGSEVGGGRGGGVGGHAAQATGGRAGAQGGKEASRTVAGVGRDRNNIPE